MTALEEDLRSALDSANVFCGDDIEERYRTDVFSRRGHPSCVVRPSTTEEVAEIVKIAARRGVSITPLGGRTGLVGGGICADGGIVLSLERMNRVQEVDEQSMTMTVEAGVPLQIAQEAAEAKGFLLPLDLGGRGSATIGGNIATNAGGTRVLRWGMARDMVLGLEAVLANGSIVTSLGKVLKDNAGYHWKDLLVGSEGTLGIITRAVLRLRPMPASSQTAIIAIPGFDKVPRLLRRFEAHFAGQLSSFELMWADFYELISTAQLKARQRPLPLGAPLYALIETLGSDPKRDMDIFQTGLEEAQSEGLIDDAVIAKTERERANFWALRDDLGDAYRPLGPMTAFDVSLPLKDMPAFIGDTRAVIHKLFPKSVALYYGHAGDSNLHLVVNHDPKDHGAELRLETAVYAVVGQLGGSISAEHGIGQAKKHFIGHTRSPQELDLMRAIKRALDPLNIMNPGKILPEPS